MITTLFQLIEQVESNGNPFALRYEIAYNPKRVGEMVKLCHCTHSTAAVLCATSFGVCQMMGDTLIDLGLNVSPIQFCNDMAMQERFFNAYVRNHHISYTLDEIRSDAFKRGAFARHYNGPGDIADYSARLLAFLNRLAPVAAQAVA